MVTTRSGAATTPAPENHEGSILVQIEVTSTEQVGEPLLAGPSAPAQTPSRNPEIYIAGTNSMIPRTPFQKSPSLPRDFRPSEYSFLPQPDFQSARESSQGKEVQVMVTEDKGVQNYSSGLPIFQASMRPLDVARTSYLDYTKTQSIKFYNKGCEKIPGDQFRGKMLITWLVQIQDKASMFTWIPILTVKGKLLTQQFAELTMEEVKAHAQVYQDKASREAQNAEMIITSSTDAR
jgi:hypothetical protein